MTRFTRWWATIQLVLAATLAWLRDEWRGVRRHVEMPPRFVASCPWARAAPEARVRKRTVAVIGDIVALAGYALGAAR